MGSAEVHGRKKEKKQRRQRPFLSSLGYSYSMRLNPLFFFRSL